jgi:hypothetical protein
MARKGGYFMTVINLTPHDIKIVDQDGNILKTYEKSGIIARIPSKEVPSDDVEGFTCVAEISSTDVIFVDENGKQWHDPRHTITKDDLFIVSREVLTKTRDPRFISPDTLKGAVRDAKGHIIGVTQFKRIR